MTARERLQAARLAMLEQRYEDALRELVWFHDHVLEECPAMYGVRLSYALSYWIDLAGLYPPARQALENIRERKTQALLRGEGNREIFQDVEAINARWDDRRATYALYLALAERFPALASQCAGHALPAIVAAEDYALADRIRPAPDADIRKRAGWLVEEIARIKRRAYSRAPARWASVKNYTNDVRRHLAICTGVGHHAEAQRLHALAIDLIHSPSLRAEVRTAIARRDDLPRLYRRGWARASRNPDRRPRPRLAK